MHTISDTISQFKFITSHLIYFNFSYDFQRKNFSFTGENETTEY